MIFSSESFSLNLAETTREAVSYTHLSVARELEQAHGLAPDDYLLSLRSSREAVLIYRNLPSSVMTRILGDLQASASKSQLPETAIGISWPCLSLTEIPELYAAVSRMTEYESFYYENYGTITFAEPLPLKEVPKNIFRLKELTLSGAETLFDTLAREKYTDKMCIRDRHSSSPSGSS